MTFIHHPVLTLSPFPRSSPYTVVFPHFVLDLFMEVFLHGSDLLPFESGEEEEEIRFERDRLKAADR